MKFRSDSTLSKLTEDQLNQLYDWLTDYSERDVVEMAATAPPQGFGLTFHRTTLSRFFRMERTRRHAEALLEAQAARACVNLDELTKEIALQLAHAGYEMAQRS